MGYTVEYAWVKLAGDFFSFELGLSVCWVIRPRRVNQTSQKVCHDFCPTLPLKWKDGTIDPFIEQARMKENTHSLNNNQNYDIYSFIHEERGDERLHLLVTKSDTSVRSSPGSELKVNFHHMANDTLPLIFHTQRHGRLICTEKRQMPSV